MRIGKTDTAWVVCSLSIIGILYVMAFSKAGGAVPLLSMLGIGADGFRKAPSAELKTAVHIIMLIYGKEKDRNESVSQAGLDLMMLAHAGIVFCRKRKRLKNRSYLKKPFL